LTAEMSEQCCTSTVTELTCPGDGVYDVQYASCILYEPSMHPLQIQLHGAESFSRR